MSKTYQQGFRTLESELENIKLPMSGKVPEWLDGSLYRNGPAKFEVGEDLFRHWFDGQAMLHRFAITGGEVSYTNRFVQSRGYKKARSRGKISYDEFATTVKQPFYKRFIPRFRAPQFAHNTLVNVIKIKDHILAVTETPEPIEFDMETLQTKGVFSYGDTLVGQMSTAHFHYDQNLRAFFNFNVIFGITSFYNVYFIPFGFKKRVLLGEMQVKNPGYMHSFAMTENYVILTEAPLLVKPKDIVMTDKPFIENYHWKPEQGTRFIVMKKDDGQIQGIYETEAFFYFHHINSFESNGEIVIDLPTFPDSGLVEKLYVDNLRMGSGGDLPDSSTRRYRLDLKTKKVRLEVLSPEVIELPRINYDSHNMRAYRYSYGIGMREDRGKDFYNQLIKIDTHNGDGATWRENNCYPGEPVFIPAPAAKTEDDGVIASVVLNGDTGKSFLVLLDGNAFEEIARAEVPHHIPFGFHGDWFNN